MKNSNNVIAALLGGTLVSLTSITPSYAWDNDLTLYAWGAGISGTATLNNRVLPNSPVDVDVEEIIDKLEMAFMGHYEGMGNSWGFGADLVYLGLGDTNDLGVTGDVDASVAEAFAIYRPNDTVDLLAGVRYTGLGLMVEMPGGTIGEGDKNLTDAFAGLRLTLPFSDSWAGAMRADVGGGSSDLTWNVVAAVNWQAGDSFAVRGGYRWLGYELDNDNDQANLELDIGFDGPFLGISFQW